MSFSGRHFFLFFASFRRKHLAQCALVFGWEYFDEFSASIVPIIQQDARARAACMFEMTLNQSLQNDFIRQSLAIATQAVPA
jgi:hypothetical protein